MTFVFHWGLRKISHVGGRVMKRTRIVAVIMAVVMGIAVAVVPADSAEAATRKVAVAKTESTSGTENVAGTKTKDKLISNDGGWQVAKNNKITKARKKIFTKATKKLTGVKYTPIAYLKSQIVAGKNHCYFCKAEAVTPNASAYFAAVYIYEDLKGNAKVTKIKKIKY